VGASELRQLRQFPGGEREVKTGRCRPDTGQADVARGVKKCLKTSQLRQLATWLNTAYGGVGAKSLFGDKPAAVRTGIISPIAGRINPSGSGLKK